MSSVVVIANPISGPARRRLTGARAVQLVSDLGHEVHLCLTDSPGHATELAGDAARNGADLVVAVGGDGTVHETALGLMGTASTLVVLPSGSGNDFARGIGCPTLAHGLRALSAGQDITVDVGTLDGEPFFNSVGLLASGEVSGRADGIWRWLGTGRYRLAALATLLTYGGQDVHWTLRQADGTTRELDERFLLAEICNGPMTGGGFRFAPDARLDDGLLDICLIRPVPVLKALRLLPEAGRGKRLDHPAVSVSQHTVLEFEVTEPVACHLDGEPDILPAGKHLLELSDQTLRVRMNSESGA